MTIVARTATLLAMALVVFACGRANPTLAGEAKAAAGGAAVESPGRGELTGFVATPQAAAGGNQAFLIAPNGSWFLATSPRASGARLIDISNGITLRFLTSPGLHIAALSISPDSKTVFARDYDGHDVAWDAATGEPAPSIPTADFRDITKLWFSYEGNDAERRAPVELLTRYHLQVHFPQLKRFDKITLNPTKEYAIVGYVGDADWKSFQIWDLKNEKTAVFFRLASDPCGFDPSAFDYDGRHLIFGNSRGESESNQLDFAIFEIAYSGPDEGPKTAHATQILGNKCSVPPSFDGGSEQEFSISPAGGLMLRGGGLPGSPEWAAWDLRNGKKVASIHPDGEGVVSSDGSTIVVLHNPKGFDSHSSRITVQRYGRRKTFNIPRSLQSDGLQVGISPNGRWIALHLAETIVVWSARDGKVAKKYQVSRDHPAIVLQITDRGDVLLVDERDGAVFVNGRWRAVRTVEHGLIVPLTPNFHAQCGVMFCDRVMADLGVVERQPRDARARDVARADLSPDGRYMIVRARDKEDSLTHDVIDIADGHVVLPGKTGNFVSNGRSLIVREIDADRVNFIKYDLPTGKPVWTVTPNRAQDGFYMTFPDGRVRFSAGAHYGDLVLVRGFEVRHFGIEETKQFVAPPDAVRDR
ncbi:hypothetical protein I3J27_20510 [Bradyrhizobium xenonodulans]|uniref:WD40 repeat domain-containing protein n=1 Tax=Bradyrhizobium xenonodulans TaxID=2736875 RepID=A0ABY7MD31_9BRAD|nr:hypothetical protein [Bradyrhizobium xenonodulans]WBL75431.1 hypothetical protein I3J27_20510 [Bradyrhizobium xenonodulans]